METSYSSFFRKPSVYQHYVSVWLCVFCSPQPSSLTCTCVTGEPRKFDPNFRGPVHNRYHTIYFLLITAHTAVKKSIKKNKWFYSLWNTSTTTRSYWFCPLCNHFGIGAWPGPPLIHHLSCNVNKDLGRAVAALSSPPHRSMGISQAGGWNQTGDTDY